MINKTLAILAGGKSSRMNYNNKALLKYKEKNFIEHIIDAGKDYKEIIIISNNKDSSILEISRLFGFSKSAIRNWLKIGTKLGWCEYKIN